MNDFQSAAMLWTIHLLMPVMVGALLASIPVAVAYNMFLARFISGITGGAIK